MCNAKRGCVRETSCSASCLDGELIPLFVMWQGQVVGASAKEFFGERARDLPSNATQTIVVRGRFRCSLHPPSSLVRWLTAQPWDCRSAPRMPRGLIAMLQMDFHCFFPNTEIWEYQISASRRGFEELCPIVRHICIMTLLPGHACSGSREPVLSTPPPGSMGLVFGHGCSLVQWTTSNVWIGIFGFRGAVPPRDACSLGPNTLKD